MIDNLAAKSSFKWAFKPDDWFLTVVFKQEDILYRLFTLKNYNFIKVNAIVFELYNLIKIERTKLEGKSQAFLAKKQFLTMFKDDKKIQITLEDEYALKELVEQYKIYEFIGWFHLGKNNKIFKHCVMQKHEILNRIYPIIDLSIRKLIGSKVISPKDPDFEDAVSNAWFQIIKYLPKINTAAVMFSIFVGTTHKATINFNKLRYKEKYNVIRMGDMNIGNDDSNSVTEDIFINTVISNDPTNEYCSIEMDFDEFESFDELDTPDIEDVVYTENSNKEYEEKLNTIENDDDRSNLLQQNVLVYSYAVSSGKIKKLCFDKIFSEFFVDLIGSNISEVILNKHTPIILDVMNSATLNPVLIDDDKNNELIYKLFKDWIKDKINIKLIKFNITDREKKDPFKKEYINKLIKNENDKLDYLKENRSVILNALISFKRNCKNFKI